MEMRLVFGICFHLLIPGSEGALTMNPVNRAVLLGTSRVNMSCSTDASAEDINWTYLPFGGSAFLNITHGLVVADAQNQSYAVEKSGNQKNNLIILSATLARAGMYYCFQSVFQASAQLIVINSDTVCSMTPNAPTELLYNQTVQMSCSVSYTANTSYVVVDMIWSKGSPATNVTSTTPQYTTSGNLTSTAKSTITQTPGNFTPFPIYRCNTTFRITGNPQSGSPDAPDYFKSTPLFSSPINVIYLKPADANSITGAKTGDRVYLGTTVTCKVEGNPPPSYSWLDVRYGNTTNSSNIQIWHSGELRCTAWNRAANNSVSINVTTYTTTSFLPTTTTTVKTTKFVATTTSSESSLNGSDGGKIGIGVGIGVAAVLILDGILLAVLCRRYEWIKRTKTDDKKTNSMEEDAERSGTHRDISNTPHYEPLNVLSVENPNDYTQLTTCTNLDAIGQSLSDRAIYENL